MTVLSRKFFLGGAAAAAPLLGSGKAQAAQTGPQGSPSQGAGTRQAPSGGAFSPATDPARWMTQNNLQSTPFSQITLYGSHDSGMSTLVEIGGSADAAIVQSGTANVCRCPVESSASESAACSTTDAPNE